MQTLHAAEPLAFLKRDAAHAAHGPPSGPECPLKHRHAALSVCAVCAWEELAGQAVHGAEPGPGLYSPGAQAGHAPPSGPVCPASQTQLLASVLPLTELEFSGQALQAAESARGLYFPGTHCTQESFVGVFWKPALHQQRSKRLVPATDVEFAGQALQAAESARGLYFPGTHCTQESFVGVCWKPASHKQRSMRLVPATDVELPGHAAQLESPELAAYVPAPQALHAPEPGPPLKLPAAHGTQALAADAPEAPAYVPAPHAAQLESPELAAYVPAPQALHAPEPVAFLYCPAAHAPHAPPSGPVCPTLQTQWVAAGAPLGECELAGHGTHTLSAVRPTAVEYFPAPQLMQVLTPTAAEYLPASQESQG